MSGILNEAFTPCPSRSRSSGWNEHVDSESLDSLVDDDSASDATAQIEFTTEVRVPTLTGVRPRRGNRAGNCVQIYEDINDKQSAPVERKGSDARARGPFDRKSSLLAQPAQRFRPRVNFAPETGRQPKLQSVQAGRNDGFVSVSRPPHKALVGGGGESNLKKDVRRSTIYAPPDDTTVPSAFMGMFSPLKRPQDNTVPGPEDTQVNSIEARIAKRQAIKPTVATARRAPLQPSVKVAQEAAFRVDFAGKNTGKENIPPGAVLEIDKANKLDHVVLPKPKRLSTVMSNSAHRTTMHVRSDATNPPVDVKKQLPKRGVLGEMQNNVHAPSTSLRSEKPRTESHDPLRNASASLKARASVLSERLGQSQTMRASKVGKSSTLKVLNNQHPLLTEDISKPALYEDDWLSHQETVITQFVNALFEHTNKDSTAAPDALRLSLVEMYQTQSFTRLYQRLQSSLSYGTLTIPNDIQACNSRLKHDLGLQRQFLDTWIQCYDLRALVPALETVVGRRISSDSTLFDVQSDSSFTNNSKVQKAVTRKVEAFVEAFLVQNNDMVHAASGAGEIYARAYRRTVLRSIMLVVLLDNAKQSCRTGLPRQLFLSSSPYKSSAEVLQALARLLLPSGGDIMKSLSHLDCHVAYKQNALQEFDYGIENIAVDLRDGVRLTRIVEVLFYTPERVRNDLEDEVTLTSGETLPLLGDGRDLPLSKHLKYPCISRASKIYNAEVALSALSSIKGGRAIVGEVHAEDIVDGYREKTIALLWALVSKWGLAGLVDWDDVRKEICRLQCKLTLQVGHDRAKQEAWFPHKKCIDGDNHASLLQQWAALLATMQGLELRNMTTSFADGRIYRSIVDEYEPFITGRGTGSCDIGNRSSVSMSLDSRLRLLGCSSQFAYLVSPGKLSSCLLDGDLTFGVLAFLCSRLLSASKRARAAVVLQRYWRTHLAKRDASRRRIAHDLAAHCAAVVQTRNKIVWAKDVITRYWRNYQSRKQRANDTRYRTLEKVKRQQRKTAGRRL
ncbi:uncharacterized protein N7496_009591 [Penicillium cataractarum]|uniref:Calponin-homology (CH) domain-containing protein n=1 Tax=Penicillium cataractarum TaxID=2100454 RepID=A0A9W9V021_9EURO|nr:uncharacterized protein N7496_009591 [Penicillium cataractarum]KAJ5363878.1 hypothetical protein N7496_009591 [Penicillium cataractarum]